MEYLKAKYQERRAKAPKRIRLTNDSALWDGLEMALRVRQVETGQKQTLRSILPDALVGLKNHSGAFAKASLQRLDLSRAAERGTVWIDADQIKQCDELSMHLYVTETRRQPGEPVGELRLLLLGSKRRRSRGRRGARAAGPRPGPRCG